MKDGGDNEAFEMRRYDYTFEEFQDHLKARETRRMEDASQNENAFFRNVMRVKDYFAEFYEPDEAIQKMPAFLVAVSHLAEFQDEYDEALFAVKHSGGIAASEALQLALHWYFTQRPRSDWGRDEDAVPIIKQKALEYIE